MPETAFDQVFVNGVLQSSAPRIISDQEIERRDAPAELRTRLPALRVWAGDAKSAAEITAMTAVERIARQAVIENRVALLSRLVLRLIWHAGEDDGV